MRTKDDSRMEAAVAELQELISTKYSSAIFTLSEGEDPDGVYLQVVVDVDDTDEVIDLVLDRLVDLQVRDGLPLYVVPVRTLERIAANQRQERDNRIALPLPLA